MLGHLQRLPDPVRGGPAARRTDPQPVAAVRLPAGAPARGDLADARSTDGLMPGRGPRDPDQARRGAVRRRPRPSWTGSRPRAGRVPLRVGAGGGRDEDNPNGGGRQHRRGPQRRRQRRGADAAPRARRRPRRRPHRRAADVRLTAGRSAARGSEWSTRRGAVASPARSAGRRARADPARRSGGTRTAPSSRCTRAMWSEHCSYKSSKMHLRTLPTEGPAVLVGPGQDAGAVDVGDGLAVVFKIESHSHPSAIEPYQGAATGVGGIVRDIISMGARPVALLDPLCSAPSPTHGTGGCSRAWWPGSVATATASAFRRWAARSTSRRPHSANPA